MGQRPPGRPGGVVTHPTSVAPATARAGAGGDVDDEPLWSNEPGARTDAVSAATMAPARLDGPEETGPGPAPVQEAYDDGGGGWDDDYVELPPEGRIPRWAGVVLVFALLIGVVGGGGYWWYQRQLDPPGGPGETVSVTIPRGASLSGIGSILDREGVVANSLIFNFYASRKGAGPFEAGVYQLRRNSDVDSVLETMNRGPTGALPTANVAKVSIPEGLTIKEMTERIAGQVPRFEAPAIAAALADGKVTTTLRPAGQSSYEGLLFPATYDVGGSETPVDFLDKMAAEMQTRVQSRDVATARARIKAQFGVDVSEYQLLIVASLVQAEAANAAEAPKIATVIYNRLAEDSTALTLGIDAVDDYGAERAGVDVATFRQTTQPYNTRLVKGLPPTPISAPGDYALSAAFEPADGSWIYYVLTDPGVHSFTDSNAEFQQFKRECIQKNLGCG